MLGGAWRAVAVRAAWCWTAPGEPQPRVLPGAGAAPGELKYDATTLKKVMYSIQFYFALR